MAAGEMFFLANRTTVEVVEVTNHSTGYCPKPECWKTVASVLDRLEIEHPGALTAAFIFRRCDSCDSINLVKDEVFGCAVCNAELDQHWNF